VTAREIPGDWYAGVIPANVEIAESAYVGSSYQFDRFRSRRPDGLRIGEEASFEAGLDVGPGGRVAVGDHAIVTTARIVCDAEVVIGRYALVSWSVLITDCYRFGPAQSGGSSHPAPRGLPRSDFPPRPVRVGENAWIGFGACVLPGVTIGEGAIVGAKAVVVDDVPAYAVVAGNPARVVRRLRGVGGASAG